MGRWRVLSQIFIMTVTSIVSVATTNTEHAVLLSPKKTTFHLKLGMLN